MNRQTGEQPYFHVPYAESVVRNHTNIADRERNAGILDLKVKAGIVVSGIATALLVDRELGMGIVLGGAFVKSMDMPRHFTAAAESRKVAKYWQATLDEHQQAA